MQTTKFAMHLEPGSDQSLQLLKAMIKTSNKEIFRGNLQILVDYKWDQMRSKVICHSFVYFVFAIGVTIDQMIKQPVKEYKIALMIATVILLVLEGLQFLKLKKEYFSIWNIIDLSG